VAVENIEVALTKEGLEDIARLVAIGATNGVVSTINFKVGFFRLGSLGDPVLFESKKVYRDDCEEIYYMNYPRTNAPDTSGGFDEDHTLIKDSNVTGYIAIISIAYVAAVAPSDLGTVEISCYVNPGFLNESGNDSFTCNEIMVYTGDGTVGNPYRSFLWGIFPDITKEREYGINLKISCQF
jgi:hypothetical protein